MTGFVYWFAMVSQIVARGGGRPSEAENYASGARSAAQQGRRTIPKGFELKDCLAAVPSK